MKIGGKIILLIAAALVMYLVSFGLTYVIDRKAYRSYDYLSSVKGFEASLLATIVQEKDYARKPSESTAASVLKECDKDKALLEKVRSEPSANVGDIDDLLNMLQEYRTAFEQLVKGYEQLNLLKVKANGAFDEISAMTDKVTNSIDQIMGMAFINSGEIDPSLSSLAVSSKNVISYLSSLMLSANRDLLLDGNEALFSRKVETTANELAKEKKNIAAIARSLKDNSLKTYPDYVNKMTPQLEVVIHDTHALWQKNNGLVEQLDTIRNKIVSRSLDIGSTIRDAVEQTRRRAFVLNLAAAGIILVALMTGGVIIGRSITGPLRGVIVGLSEGARQITAASGQLAISSQQLADVTSEQAASLEETSSSLEEMASMTRQNDQNAQTALSSRTEAFQTLQEAEASMKQMVEAMNAIRAGGEETGKIIKTIDEIAFQTNLLALNAAVEAARAGEAGAGFAVVADEVRNLALRAAEAARSTQSLIESTVKEINGGVKLLDATVLSFNSAMIHNKGIGDILQEIAAASKEQSQGVEQINRAVSEMDKVVQHNAAEAEESASASSELNAQADKIKEFVQKLADLVERS